MYKNDSKSFYYNGSNLKISEASYPADVYWEHMKNSEVK
jgi:hypothetical protein